MAPITTKLAANDFLNFVNASPTPFHAVKSVKQRLSKAGFQEIKVYQEFGQSVFDTNYASRRKNPGHRHVFRAESIISPEMGRPLLHSRSASNGNLVMLYR